VKTDLAGRRAGINLLEIIIATVVCGAIAWLCLSFLGCGKNGDGGKERDSENSLAARLAGEWVAVDDESGDYHSHKLHFTSGSNKLVYSYVERVKLGMQSRMEAPTYTGEERKHSDTYEIVKYTERSITIKGSDVVIEFEFATPDEFLAICDSKYSSPKVQGRYRRSVPRAPAPATNSGDSDDADLRGVFLGVWAKKSAGGEFDCTLEFTENTATMTWKERGGHARQNPLGNVVSKYSSEGTRITITDPGGQRETFVVDFVSGREMVFALDRKDDTRRHIPDDGMVKMFCGKWTRTSRPAGRLPASASIIAAKLDVGRIEEKLKIAEAKQQGIRKERDDIGAKLREMGENADELKGNLRARGMAESYAKLTAEDEGLDSVLATIDAQLLKARSLVRKMELEQAGISDDEIRSLSRQLREIEARTDTTPRPVTPLDTDAALKAAFAKKKPSDKKR
jgi:hypothetical protein